MAGHCSFINVTSLNLSQNKVATEYESRIHLILDVYRAHFTESVRKHAENLNIELIPIPAGMTDEMQPLDLRIFGPLKRYATRLFRLRLRIDPDVNRTKKDACWSIYCKNVPKDASELY